MGRLLSIHSDIFIATDTLSKLPPGLKIRTVWRRRVLKHESQRRLQLTKYECSCSMFGLGFSLLSLEAEDEMASYSWRFIVSFISAL